jgi:hypothetical protein
MNKRSLNVLAPVRLGDGQRTTSVHFFGLLEQNHLLILLDLGLLCSRDDIDTPWTRTAVFEFGS